SAPGAARRRHGTSSGSTAWKRCLSSLATGAFRLKWTSRTPSASNSTGGVQAFGQGSGCNHAGPLGKAASKVQGRLRPKGDDADRRGGRGRRLHQGEIVDDARSCDGRTNDGACACRGGRGLLRTKSTKSAGTLRTFRS